MEPERQTMRPEEHIRRAEDLCRRIQSASSTVGARDNQRLVKGADPNELKKLLAFLNKHRDLKRLEKLIQALPNTNFAGRSKSTPAYYRNIQSSLGREFYALPVGDALQILGWVCRLI